jgi:hypothetical protein
MVLRLIDYERAREIIVKGLSDYLGHPVIRQNQDAEPPSYPYSSYTITVLMSQNKGTYGRYDDGMDRKPFLQTWSISTQSDNNAESVMNAVKAREWFDHYGTSYLNDNDIIVQSVGAVMNRDNFLTVGYEYKHGFDVMFWLLDAIDKGTEVDGSIDTFEPTITTEGGGDNSNN